MGGSRHDLEVSTRGDREIRMTRVFDAPRDLVFEAHSSCEHMKRWWGPRNYEVTECDVDFRTGGKWRIVHRNAEGTDFVFFGEYLEIVAPETIKWTFSFEGAPGDPSIETMTLEEDGGKTKLTAVSVAASKEARDAIIESGMETGARETFERLDEYLEELAARSRS